MSDTITRPATRADIPAITEIYAESVINATASFEMVPPDEKEMARRFKELTAQGYPFLVAEGGGAERRILGYGYAGPYRPRPAYRNTVEDSIYLATDARGKGIGGVLLRSIIDTAGQISVRWSPSSPTPTTTRPRSGFTGRPGSPRWAG